MIMGHIAWSDMRNILVSYFYLDLGFSNLNFFPLLKTMMILPFCFITIRQHSPYLQKKRLDLDLYLTGESFYPTRGAWRN